MRSRLSVPIFTSNLLSGEDRRYRFPLADQINELFMCFLSRGEGVLILIVMSSVVDKNGVINSIVKKLETPG